jgi:hypothetical protein
LRRSRGLTRSGPWLVKFAVLHNDPRNVVG